MPLSILAGGGLASVAGFAKTIVDRFWPPQADPTKKLEATLEVERMIQERENTLIAAQREIVVAEMTQGDSFTKRARPSIVYAGLFFIFLIHVAFPMVTYFTRETLPELTLPHEFWWAWTGVCSIWMIGRSAEKRGVESKVVEIITGGRNK